MLSVGRWIHVLIAHLLLTAGKKMSLDKSLQVHAKSWKITFKPLKGAHIDGYANKEMKVEKKKKIVNNKHLSLKKLYLPEQEVTHALLKLIIWQAVVQMYPIL